MQKLRNGDQVIVIAGKDKGQQGAIKKILENKVVVEGVNRIKKHVKPNPQAGIPGGIEQREAPIHISNVAIYNKGAEKGDRVGIKVLENGKKARFYKSDGKLID